MLSSTKTGQETAFTQITFLSWAKKATKDLTLRTVDFMLEMQLLIALTTKKMLIICYLINHSTYTILFYLTIVLNSNLKKLRVRKSNTFNCLLSVSFSFSRLSLTSFLKANLCSQLYRKMRKQSINQNAIK